MTYAEWLAECPLKKWMKANGITHAMLAVEIRATRQSVYIWVTGQASISETYSQAIARLMGITQGEFDAQMQKWRDAAPKLEVSDGNES